MLLVKLNNFAATNDAVLGLYTNANTIPVASFKNIESASTVLEAFSGHDTGNYEVIRRGNSSENILGVFTESGNVGIGTNNPTSKLHIASTGAASTVRLDSATKTWH